VKFTYPERPDAPVFGGLNLSVKPGKKLALVGSSGSGKSTVIQLIERFYDTEGGEVLIDGINIQKFDLYWLRQQIGLVSQQPILFSCSIEENIRFGKPDATLKEIKAAAKKANAHDFIKKLPDRYDTRVGEKGDMMSGGQRQRIAIARAILKDPKILLLDEATSALDSESESLVQEALDKLMKGKTTVIVAHRLSTVRNADTIAVMGAGKIREKGTHDELIAAQGEYALLVSRQMADTSEQSEPDADDGEDPGIRLSAGGVVVETLLDTEQKSKQNKDKKKKKKKKQQKKQETQ